MRITAAVLVVAGVVGALLYRHSLTSVAAPQRPSPKPQQLLSVGGIGRWTWNCKTGHAYQVGFAAASDAPTLTVSVSRDGHRANSYQRNANQQVVLPYGHDRFEQWEVAGGTEALRRRAILTITLGPEAGECLIPFTQLSVTTVTNG